MSFGNFLRIEKIALVDSADTKMEIDTDTFGGTDF